MNNKKLFEHEIAMNEYSAKAMQMPLSLIEDEFEDCDHPDGHECGYCCTCGEYIMDGAGDWPGDDE